MCSQSLTRVCEPRLTCTTYFYLCRPVRTRCFGAYLRAGKLVSLYDHILPSPLATRLLTEVHELGSKETLSDIEVLCVLDL